MTTTVTLPLTPAVLVAIVVLALLFWALLRARSVPTPPPIISGGSVFIVTNNVTQQGFRGHF